MIYVDNERNTVRALQFHAGPSSMTDIWNMIDECEMTYKYDSALCTGVLGIKCGPDNITIMESDWVVIEDSNWADLKEDKLVMYNDVDFNDKYKESQELI